MTRVFNQHRSLQKRRVLRREQTDVEKRLWSRLRNRQVAGFRFFRQYSVGAYILDFYCPKKKLGIELDGGQHAQIKHKEYEQERSDIMNHYGIKVLRFWNNQVVTNMEGILEVIYSMVTNPT